MKTFYAVHWWLKDNSDFREIDLIPTLTQARQKVKSLKELNKGYHSFTIYAYHAELVNDDFVEGDRVYKHQKWERIDDDFEKIY